MYALINVVNGRSEYLCTAASDIEELPTMSTEGTQGTNETDDAPCAVGSAAMVTGGESTELYVLTPDNEWVKL